MPKLYLMLDFDGVLHSTRYKAPRWEHVKAFEDVVREAVNEGQVAIVISSTWRKDARLSELRKKFSPDIARSIVGVTPVFKQPGLDSLRTPEQIARAIHDPSDTHEGVRQREIEQWIGKSDPGASWLAIDDDRTSFYAPYENLLYVDGIDGLRPSHLVELGRRIAAALNDQPAAAVSPGCSP